MGDGRDSVDLAALFGLDGARVRVGRPVARGHQGLIYLRHGHGGQPEALKVFSQAYLFRSATQLRAKLAWMIEHPPLDPGISQRSLAWPRALVVDSAGGLAGYTMPAAPRAVELRQLTVAHDPVDGPSLPAGWSGRFDDWRTRVETAESLAALAAALHERGYVIGDFNDTVIRVTSRGQATLVDCDGIQVDADGRTFLAEVSAPEFTPAELLAQRGRPLTSAADDFALAVHCFGLLMGGHRPFSGLWRDGGDPPTPLQLARWGVYATAGDARLEPPPGMPPAEILPANARAMFELAFGPGAGVDQRRPTASDWRDALGALAAGLVTCARTPTHHYRPGLTDCPWCARTDEARRHASSATAVALTDLPTPVPAPAVGLPRPTPPVPAAVPLTPVAPGGAPPNKQARRPTAGPQHRRPGRGRSAWRWAARLGSAVLCLVGATLMVVTVLGAVLRGSTVDGAGRSATGSGPTTFLALTPTTATPTTAAASGTSRMPSTLWRAWLGRWTAGPDAVLPGFGLLISDAGPTPGGEEQITAAETTPSCPVRYEGLTRGWAPGTVTTYPQDASVDLVLDAHLLPGQDASRCVLLHSSSYFTAGGADLVVTGAIHIQVIAADDDLAKATVTLTPGAAPIGLTLTRA
jgi:hypothetical protein